MQSTISELVAAVVDGEIHRYAEIVRQFDRRVRAVVRSRITDPGAVEDLVQETFYRAFKQLDKLQNRDELENWLAAIARNCVTDYLRQSTRRNEKERISGRLNSDRRDRASAAVNSWVWDEVSQLPPESAEILRLRYQHSFTYQEISSRLGLPESTIRGKIYLARKSLRQRLSDKGLFP